MVRQLQQYWLREYVRLPAEQHVAALGKWLGCNDEAAIDAALERLSGTGLGALDNRLALLEADRAAFEASKDPAVQLAVALMPTVMEMEAQQKAREGDELLARPLFLDRKSTRLNSSH